MKNGPSEFVREGDFNNLKGLYYRFQKDDDIMNLFKVLRKVYRDFGGIGAMLRAHYRGDIRETLWKVSDHLFVSSNNLTFFFPQPSSVNPLKRWNLYLRWMVRKDVIDRGLWDFINRKDLIIPLDTHVFKIGKCLGWTKRPSQSYRTALDITEALRAFAPDDPLKYDFFLCHKVGIAAGCTGKRTSQCEKVCPIYEI